MTADNHFSHHNWFDQRFMSNSEQVGASGEIPLPRADDGKVTSIEFLDADTFADVVWPGGCFKKDLHEYMLPELVGIVLAFCGPRAVSVDTMNRLWDRSRKTRTKPYVMVSPTVFLSHLEKRRTKPQTRLEQVESDRVFRTFPESICDIYYFGTFRFSDGDEGDNDDDMFHYLQLGRCVYNNIDLYFFWWETEGPAPAGALFSSLEDLCQSTFPWLTQAFHRFNIAAQ